MVLTNADSTMALVGYLVRKLLFGCCSPSLELISYHLLAPWRKLSSLGRTAGAKTGKGDAREMAMVPDHPDRGGGGGEEEDLAPGESGRLVEGPAANGPLLCAFKGLGDAFAGAVMGSVFGFGSGLFKRQGFKVALREGGSSAKTFALLSGVHSIVACYLRRIRGVEDALNAGIAGCATGLALSTPGTPQAMLQSCVSFGVFSYILENINKPRAALAAPLKRPSRMGIQEKNSLHSMPLLVPVLPPFTLPPPMFAGPFSLFCNESLQRMPRRQQSRPL